MGSGHALLLSQSTRLRALHKLARGGGEEERKKRVLEEEKGRRRGGGGEERYKEEEFRFSLQADGGKEKRRRELRQETRRYWAQLSCAVPS